MSTPDDPSEWHGHVRPRPDGVRMRCGAIRMCSVCQEEAIKYGDEFQAREAAYAKHQPVREDASISGIAPVAPMQGVVLKPSFPKTAFGGGKPEDFEPAKLKKSSDTEFELTALLGL